MTKLIQMKIMMTLSALLLLASTAGAQEQGGRWSLTPMAGMTWSTLSGDNYVQEPDNSQNFNRYSYCLNNPLKYVDSSGESIIGTMCVFAAVFAAGNTIAHAIQQQVLVKM